MVITENPLTHKIWYPIFNYHHCLHCFFM